MGTKTEKTPHYAVYYEIFTTLVGKNQSPLIISHNLVFPVPINPITRLINHSLFVAQLLFSRFLDVYMMISRKIMISRKKC